MHPARVPALTWLIARCILQIIAVDAGCSNISLPAIPPESGISYNGIVLPDVCFEAVSGSENSLNFFTIADWGGLSRNGGAPVPADNRYSGRPFVQGVDDRAQLLVAGQMKQRAITSRPRFVVNAGDMFYWDGIQEHCGLDLSQVSKSASRQFLHVFEQVYSGPYMDIPWLGSLGNHDFGGRRYTHGWDQIVAYSWKANGRWIVPSLYWRQRVRFAETVADFFFVDTNVLDARSPQNSPNTNICSYSSMNLDFVDSDEAASLGFTCGEKGPRSPTDCVGWFQKLWNEQLIWLEKELRGSVTAANWQIIVTHFPPEAGWKLETWQYLADRYGIDLMVTGHRHQQEIHASFSGPLGATAYVVTGGGGGITSERAPSLDGRDDQYGFMDIAISKDQISIEAISHSGLVRASTVLKPRVASLNIDASTVPHGPGRVVDAQSVKTQPSQVVVPLEVPGDEVASLGEGNRVPPVSESFALTLLIPILIILRSLF